MPPCVCVCVCLFYLCYPLNSLEVCPPSLSLSLSSYLARSQLSPSSPLFIPDFLPRVHPSPSSFSRLSLCFTFICHLTSSPPSLREKKKNQRRRCCRLRIHFLHGSPEVHLRSVKLHLSLQGSKIALTSSDVFSSSPELNYEAVLYSFLTDRTFKINPYAVHVISII